MLRRLAILCGAVAAVVIVSAPAALAHVELATSSPDHGSLLGESPDAITLTFTVPASPAGDGIALYDDASREIPSRVELVSDLEIRVIPEQRLSGGLHTVAWTMRAGDAHPRSGSVSFVVTGADITAADASAAIAEASAPRSAGSSSVGTLIGAATRATSMAAALFGIGALLFAYFVFEGLSDEARRLGFWVRRAGLVVALTAPVELVAQSALLNGVGVSTFSPSALADAASGDLGSAVALRLIGGAALLGGTRLITLRSVGPPPTAGGHAKATHVHTAVRERFHVAASPIALSGAAAVALSFALDGHSAVVGPGLLVRLASVTHVVAAGTWLGGVVTLALVLFFRRRSGARLDAARLVIPFASLASVAVVYVGLAGTVLALAIVDTPSAFFSTGWGRVLLIKLGLVGVAGALGAYNHFFVVPDLKSNANDADAAARIAATAAIETCVLLAIAATSGILVGLSP